MLEESSNFRSLLLLLLLLKMTVMSDAERVLTAASEPRASAASAVAQPGIRRMQLINKNALRSERSCENSKLLQ